MQGVCVIRKKDIIKLCEKHTDCYFLAFTNGTLIDEAFADDMLRVGNFAPAISVEGYEEETDMRRGKGTFKAVMKAMEILKRKRLLFGMSTCYHRKNVDVVGSSEYLDFMIDQGAAFVWYFTYMPVGNDAVPELMVTSEQRKFMYEQVRMFRKTKPIFAMDFWNDGEYVRGCIAGGRYYFHIGSITIRAAPRLHRDDRNNHRPGCFQCPSLCLFALPLTSPSFCFPEIIEYRTHYHFQFIFSGSLSGHL